MIGTVHVVKKLNKVYSTVAVIRLLGQPDDHVMCTFEYLEKKVAESRVSADIVLQFRWNNSWSNVRQQSSTYKTKQCNQEMACQPRKSSEMGLSSLTIDRDEFDRAGSHRIHKREGEDGRGAVAGSAWEDLRLTAPWLDVYC